MNRKKKPSGKNRPLYQSGRNPGDYRRRTGERPPNKTILILCEGRQTEPNYFNSMRAEKRAPGIRVEVVRGGGDRTNPVNLVSAVELFKLQMDWDADRDQAWCVFDLEGANVPAAFQQAVRFARQKSINLAVSNPAFEFWYLLHFRDTTRPFLNGEEVKTALREWISDYEEASNVYELLRGSTDTALNRCHLCRAQAVEGWETFPNPSTGVDRLVKVILNRGSENPE